MSVTWFQFPRRRRTKTFLKRNNLILFDDRATSLICTDSILLRRLLWFPLATRPCLSLGWNCQLSGRRGDVAQVRRTPPVATFAGGRHCSGWRLQIQRFVHCTPTPFCHSSRLMSLKLNFNENRFIHLTFVFDEFGRVGSVLLAFNWKGRRARVLLISVWEEQYLALLLLPILCYLLFSTSYPVHPPF